MPDLGEEPLIQSPPVDLPADTAAAIRDLIAEHDAATATDLTLELIDLLRPITGPELDDA